VCVCVCLMGARAHAVLAPTVSGATSRVALRCMLPSVDAVDNPLRTSGACASGQLCLVRFAACSQHCTFKVAAPPTPLPPRLGTPCVPAFAVLHPRACMSAMRSRCAAALAPPSSSCLLQHCGVRCSAARDVLRAAAAAAAAVCSRGGCGWQNLPWGTPSRAITAACR
jgi:hypothetical protein